MKKLLASASYSFNNFYDNLNARGQIVFTVIVVLIAVLLLILVISYIFQSFKNKKWIKKTLKKNRNLANTLSKEDGIAIEKAVQESKGPVINEVKVEEKTNDISDIAGEIKKALEEERTIDLTSFEEEQERNAIISIDELMARAKELEIIEDEQTGVNYMEKYNLEPAEVTEAVESITRKETESAPIKSFKVSQVISPVYGVKKEVINNDRF